ncbi:filamentous hemagglutinin N-terminal domain-containing protein [Proteus hauseri]|uniref:two-partner secretion domain-containing protein n=1 Tax=Proteus hauseri TaxID=183417 RepID=UPI0032DA4B59
MKVNKLFFASSVLFFSQTVLADEKALISKDEYLSKALSINYQDGKAIIDIEKSDIRGISHNYYTKFNVDKQGAVFNNPSDSHVTTIINEVLSQTESHLEGELSVDGQRVNMVIANPNGITCSNCNFNNIEKLTLITGFTSRSEPKGFFLMDQSKITLKTDNDLIYKDIVIISNSVQFKGRGNLNANKMQIISDELRHSLYDGYISKNKGNYNGTVSVGKNTTLNVNDFSFSSNKTDFINRGVINVGVLNVHSNAKFKNFKEVNILNSRILPLLTMFDIKEQYQINLHSNSNIKSTLFSNNKSSKLTVYKTNLNIDIPDESLINKGDLRFEHTNLDIKSKNYFQKSNANLINIYSAIRLINNDVIDIDGGIYSINNDDDDKIKILQGKKINIKNENKEKIIIENLNL